MQRSPGWDPRWPARGSGQRIHCSGASASGHDVHVPAPQTNRACGAVGRCSACGRDSPVSSAAPPGCSLVPDVRACCAEAWLHGSTPTGPQFRCGVSLSAARTRRLQLPATPRMTAKHFQRPPAHQLKGETCPCPSAWSRGPLGVQRSRAPKGARAPTRGAAAFRRIFPIPCTTPAMPFTFRSFRCGIAAARYRRW